MTQSVIVKLLDDFDGSEAAETMVFGLDGRTYEIDVSEENATHLREFLGAYVEVARDVTPNARGRKRVASNGKAPSNGNGKAGRQDTDPKVIRAWAIAQGIEVPSRGRLPGAVIEQYQAAN